MAETVRNRIVDFKTIARTDLVLHPCHQWIHPDEQKRMLEKFTQERGSTSVLYVRPHPTQVGKWEIIDGKMRFDNLKLDQFSCAISDLNDAEAAEEVKLHDALSAMAITTDPAILAMLKSAGDRLPDAEQLLRSVPAVNSSTAPDAAAKAGQAAKKPLREIKPGPDQKYIYVLTVLPVSKFGEAQSHLAGLEAISEVTVQRAGEEPRGE